MKDLNIQQWPGLNKPINRVRTNAFYPKTTHMKKILYFLFGLILLNSCIKEIDIPIEYTDPKLVLNGFFTSDSLWNVHLSASKYIYSSGEIPVIPDATIIIMDQDGSNIVLVPQGDGYYRSTTQYPQPGHTYTIQVAKAGYETITSTATTINQVPLKSVELGEKVLIDSYEYRKIRIKFDDPSETNFYRINFKQSMKEPDWNTVDELDSIWTSYPNWVMYQDANNSLESGYSSTSSMLISDYYFNGNEHTIDVFVDDYYFQNGYYDEQNAHLVIEFHTVSMEYYYFASSLENYNNSDEFALFASQPVQIFTNIENGLGVFASYASQLDSIKMGL